MRDETGSGGEATTPGGTGAVAPARPRRARARRPLSVRLLLFTALAVMAAEILIFVPSVAHFQTEWLRARIESAAVAGLAADMTSAEEGSVIEPAQQAELLGMLESELVAISSGGAARLLARAETVPVPDRKIDLSALGPLEAIRSTFRTLVTGGDETLRVSGPIAGGEATAEIVMPDAPLRRALLDYARNIFLLSLAIATFVALLVYAAITTVLVRPIERMTRAMVAFAEDPEDASRILEPEPRRDEIGIAQAELAAMQAQLSRTLREQRHLAELGLAVSKINHDLRNILASAQLVSDRLSDLPDPRVQRFAPLLIRSLDRALDYTRSVLAYGRAVEAEPARRRVRLRLLVAEVFETLAVPDEAGIEFNNAVAEDFEIDVDPDQFFRVLSNLCRNAVQALEGQDDPAIVRRITVDAVRDGANGARIGVEDTGPGLPARARENLFRAFRGSARSGGTGLGLAIAAEIVRGHGGQIGLVDRDRAGTRFEIRLPSPAFARALLAPTETERSRARPPGPGSQERTSPAGANAAEAAGHHPPERST